MSTRDEHGARAGTGPSDGAWSRSAGGQLWRWFTGLFASAGGAPGRRWRTILPPLIGLLVIVVFFESCTEYVRPNQRAILQSRYGKGIAKDVRAGGKLYVLSFGQELHLFPTDLQVLEMLDHPSELPARVSGQRVVPGVEIDTSDGSKMRVDATVQYRIEDPYLVMTKIGPGRLFEDNAVIARAAPALKRTLGTMVAEDFYNEELRIKEALACRDMLNSELKEKGLKVEHVLIRQYYYRPDYQAQIEEKKVNDQLVFTRKSEAEAQKEDARKRQIEAQGQAKVEIEGRRGETEVAKIQADAGLNRRRKQADGDLLVKLADAKGTQLENDAYRAFGAENLVGLKMADVFKGVDFIILPAGGKSGFNPLDLNQMLKLFDVKP